MHVLFDLRTLDNVTVPVRTYLTALVDSLVPALGEADRVTLLFAENPLPFTPIKHRSVRYRFARWSGRSIAGARELRATVNALHPDVYWSADPLLRVPVPLRGKKLKVVFAVQDLRHFTDANRFSRFERFRWWLIAQRQLIAADALVCPSHALSVRLIAQLGLRVRKHVHVILNGIHPAYRMHSEIEISEVRRRYLVPQKYTMIVNRADGTHNLATPLKALAENEEVPSMPLVIVGDGHATTALRNVIRSCHLEGLVRFIDDTLPAADLSALYSGAQVTFEPTLRNEYLPAILQSMASGTPVICCGTEANEELFGAAALRIHPTNVAEWRKAFTALMVSTVLRDRLIARGSACAMAHTWTSSARASFALALELVK
ncbi:MAG: glycosyltransferase [Kiritimatiellia bacterium]